MNKVLVIGDNQVGKKFVVKHIIQAQSTPNQTSNNQSVTFVPNTAKFTEDQSVPYHTAHWPLVTKYYRADVEFNLLNDNAVSDFTPQSIDQLVQSSLAKAIQSMLLIYDPSNTDSFQRITRWAALINSAVTSDRVMLCIANESKPESIDQSIIEQARDWCQLHNIEHVSIPFVELSSQLIAPIPSSASDRWRHDDDGLPRIVNALQANEWDDMSMKSESERRSEMQARADRAELIDAEEARAQSLTNQLDQEEADEEAEFEAHLIEEDRLAAERAALIAALNADQPPLAPTEEEELTVEEEEHAVEQVEKQLAGFEAMFEQMRSIRAEAVASRQSTGNPVSDAERRKRAEDAIMSMLTSMGIGPDDDDDDDDDM